MDESTYVVGRFCNSDNVFNDHKKKPASFSETVDRRSRKTLPLFFERSSENFLNPIFDSDILESEFQRFSVNVDKFRFHVALLYISTACMVLSLFFGLTHIGTSSHILLTTGSAIIGLVTLVIFLILKFVKIYTQPIEAKLFSVIISIFIGIIEVVTFFFIDQKDFSYGARFGLATCIIIVIYTMMPALPIYGCCIIAVLFSLAHELSSSLLTEPKRDAAEIVCLVLLHLCIHMIGLSLIFMAQLRRRSTFWRVGQSMVAKQDLTIEQEIKNSMIRSVMPKKVADFLIQNGMNQKHPKLKLKQRCVQFRPFNMYHMKDVSILFADIVGFTKMSAKKEAGELVQLLNLLFGKFDELTQINHCEKISTLGDCYYCVAGCPEKSPFHALACIEMGLDITDEIKRHDIDDIDMRVGIHTGNVLCGIVGDRRLRFDVWSNDVVLANKMESQGRPGHVHITECTYSFVRDLEIYEVEEGAGYDRSEVDGGHLKSYYVLKRRDGILAHKPWQSYNQKQGEGSNETNKEFVDVAVTLCKGLELETSSSANNGEQAFLNPLILKNSTGILNHLAKSSFSVPTFNCGLPINETRMREVMRASNDKQFVKLMHRKTIPKEYFFHPPLHWMSLNFIDKLDMSATSNHSAESDMMDRRFLNPRSEPREASYRKECFDGFKLHPQVLTFASPKVHFLFDVSVNSLTITVLVMAIVLKMYSKNFPMSLAIVIPVTMLSISALLIFQSVRVCPNSFPRRINQCVRFYEDFINVSGTDDVGSIELHDMRGHGHAVITNVNFQDKLFTPWVIMHICGGVIICLPVTMVFASYEACSYPLQTWKSNDLDFFSIFVFVCFLHFCSFTQLSWLMKAMIEIFWFLAIILLLQLGKGSSCIEINTKSDKMLTDDIAICIALQFLLVLLLNHIHEKGVRANFYGDKEAAGQKTKALEHKEVADLLVSDMFPSHVFEQLQHQLGHSQNYDVVGVLFASITNFYEFYEENFEGGIECIRVLHEIVADFDKLLDKYDNDIEKIKTVSGTTFMAASGLNCKGGVKTHEYYHLHQLLEFALDLKRTLDEFNTNMLGFTFHLRCGFNAGPVTAGVIGTMKPQYDIWGDTVNIASRMESTGVSDKIQLAEECMNKLTDFFTFEKRGAIPVKGKGHISTYLLVDRICENVNI